VSDVAERPTDGAGGYRRARAGAVHEPALVTTGHVLDVFA